MGNTRACLVMALLVLAAAVANAASTGPVGWWKLDETSGTTAADSSKNKNDGTVTGGGQWVAGQLGGALLFDGTDDYVSLPIGPLISTLTNSTFAVWANFSGQGGAWQRLFDIGTGTGVNMFLTPAIGGSNTGVMRFAITIGGSGAESQLSATATLPTGWHHVAVVIDATAMSMQLYLDGAVVATAATQRIPSDLGATTQNWLGRSEYAADGYYSGNLDDFRIYDRALTLEEIGEVMQGGLTGQTAAGPRPVNRARDVLRETILTWVPSDAATAHDVYLGTLREDVANASRTKTLGVLVGQGHDANSYDPPGRLELGQTYYWRVDEVSNAGATIFKGSIWSFTVEPVSYPVANVTATASSSNSVGMGPEKTVNGSGLDPNTDQHGTTSNDMWLSNKKGPQPTWIQFAFDQPYKLDKMLVWNSNQAIESLIGVGARDVTVEYSDDANNWNALGDFEFTQAPGEVGYSADTIVDFAGVTTSYVKLTIHSNWGEVLVQYGLAEVRFLYTPLKAREPSPAADANNVHPQVTLSWRPGREAASHKVYVGADPNNLSLAGTVNDPTYELAADLLKTYYWNVVEVNDAQTPSSWASDVWSFSTAEYVVVDDFESYTNESPDRAFQTWIDGAGFSADEFFPNGNTGNGSGALVGYDPTTSDIMETVTVHGGGQSMPLFYDNSAAPRYSEAERTFAVPQDWTKHGITTLVLYFRGALDNSAAPVYVKINGKQVMYNNGAASTTTPVWKQWNIDLASVKGTNLKSVNTLTIGVGDGSSGGTGILFVDDILLYATAPQVVTPADPGTKGLAALYSMEGNMQDSSGKNLHGTTSGEPEFIAGMPGYGKALTFDGVSDYADLPIGPLLGTLTSSTFAAWVNITNVGDAWQRIFDFGSGTTNYMFLSPNNGLTGTVRFAIRTATVTEQTVTAPAGVSTGWHHVAVVIDAASMTLRLYEDGILVRERPTTLLPKDMAAKNQNWLGRSQWTADPYFNGSLDDFRIYNRALSESEVRYLAGDR
jgi:hypothetical protein